MEAAEQHLRSLIRSIGTLPGGSVHEDGGALWAPTGIAWPCFNNGIGGDPSTVSKAVAARTEAGVPFFWWVVSGTDQDVVATLLDQGLIEFDHDAPWEEAVWLISFPTKLILGSRSSEPTTRQPIDCGVRPCALRTNCPPAAEEGWFEPARRVGFSGLPWQQWTAEVDGEPLGVTMRFCGAGIAGLYAIGVLPAARDRPGAHARAARGCH